MSRFHSHINSAKKILDTYQGDKPFSIFLKLFFSSNKKYGAKDRKSIASLCFHYFRMGMAFTDIAIDEKLLVATFLCETTDSLLLKELRPEWNEKISIPVREKINLVRQNISLLDFFPFCDLLSSGIEMEAYSLSMLTQPDLFIRIRPQSKDAVINQLQQSNFHWQLMNDQCVRLKNSDKVADFFKLDKEVVVQDANSQQVLNYLKQPGLLETSVANNTLSVWDCCAASGGKSILLMDVLDRKIDLTVSDIRESILTNLHQRFKSAGIINYETFVTDLGGADNKMTNKDFDLIICDAPCSGSGTWGRTPDQLVFFKKTSIQYYADLQSKIVANAITHLKPGGLLVYITCSVFKAENEMVVNFVTESLECKLLDQQLLKGYQQQSDSMFVAIFKKG
jgi:16S rRNA (cytosine967-C5)-methyltransferase